MFTDGVAGAARKSDGKAGEHSATCEGLTKGGLADDLTKGNSLRDRANGSVAAHSGDELAVVAGRNWTSGAIC